MEWRPSKTSGPMRTLGLVYGIGIPVLLAVGVAIWVIRSHYEAETYERLTGVHVTTWDAMWVQLRVIEPARRPADDDG